MKILTFILSAIGIIIGSWILIHVLALAGVFLAAAYPLWWLVAPRQTFCLLCRAKQDGEQCPFCHSRINKSQGVSPDNLRSAILNGLLILAFSLISIGIVFGESQLLFKFGFSSSPKTASFIIPSKGQYRIGEIFPMRIEINNAKSAINAVQADIGFDPDKLEVIDISTKESFANIFIQKEINNTGGWGRLTGGLPNPGYFGTHGVFGTVYFRAKSPGLVKINFLASSMVLANDGRSTNILKDLPAASYLILPDKLTDDEVVQQNKIFSNKAVLGTEDVLGTSTQETQLKFYDEGRVLGAQTISNDEVAQAKHISIFRSLLQLLERVDYFVIHFWQTVFSKK